MQGWLTIGTEIDTKSFDAQIKKLESDLEGLEQEFELAKKWNLSENDLKDYQAQIEKTKNKIADLKKKQDELARTDLSNLGKGMSNIVKSVARWGMAVFGIRSAYMAVRNAINTISQGDEQLKADIDYMKSAMAYVFEPIVRRVVELAKQLVFYIGYLIKAWTGHDIFASANKNLKKSVGSAKELRKQLASFDEMNILSDDSSGGGAGSPSFDFENMDAPKWLKWLAKNGKKLISLLSFDGIMKGIKNLRNWMDTNVLGWLKDKWGKVGEFIYLPIQFALTFIETLFDGLITGIKTVIKGIKKIFTGDFIGGIIDIFTGLLEILLSPFRAWYNAVKEWLYNILDLLGLVKEKRGSAMGGGAGAFSGGGGGGGRAKGGIYYPKLAIGGIINQPGAGVPYHGATIGERGAEAVVPLTDSQQMMLLGEAIGKYITINANITNTMNGRVISRELQKVQNETNFAMNR